MTLAEARAAPRKATAMVAVM
jgi:hypothetical protein